MLATPCSHRPRSTPSAARGLSPTMNRWAMCLTPRGRCGAERGAAAPSCRRSASRRRSAAGSPAPPRGSRSGAGRGRRATGTPGRRRRTGTAPPAARRSREASSIARASSARIGWRALDGNAAASSAADPADLGLECVPVRDVQARLASSLTGDGTAGGVDRSIASQLMSRARSSSSTSPPPRSPNSRLAYSR